MRGAAASLEPSGWEGSAVIWRYSSVLAVWMSSLAPLPKASSSPASFLTRLTRMGVKAFPSRSSKPCRLAPCQGAATGEGMLRRMVASDMRLMMPLLMGHDSPAWLLTTLPAGH